MKSKPTLTAIYATTFFFVLLNFSTVLGAKKERTTRFNQVDSRGIVLGNPNNSIEDFRSIYKIVTTYKVHHQGDLPGSIQELRQELAAYPSRYGFKDFLEARKSFTNPDYHLTDKSITPEIESKTWVYRLPFKRPNGERITAARDAGSKDVLAWTSLYVYRNVTYDENEESEANPVGFYLTLWDDGSTERVPFDNVLFESSDGKSFGESFYGQSEQPFSLLTYEELYQGSPPVGKPLTGENSLSVPDNNGPEGLVQLSRRVSYPNRYGIEREQLWKQFDPSQAEFTLADVQAGAMKLGLDTQVQKLSLSQLQKSGSSALLFLKDDVRIVTLTALDDDRAVVVDRGLTHNVERGVLEGRYSGEALVPTKALAQQAGIVADDPVRSVQLQSLDAEVLQTFMLKNTGKTPVTLQLEYPLLGVTDSKLSKDTLAPGETATLDLKVKWRSILKASTQNVLVSLQTNDPIVPRLQLAILLNPPQAAATK